MALMAIQPVIAVAASEQGLPPHWDSWDAGLGAPEVAIHSSQLAEGLGC